MNTNVTLIIYMIIIYMIINLVLINLKSRTCTSLYIILIIDLLNIIIHHDIFGIADMHIDKF